MSYPVSIPLKGLPEFAAAFATLVDESYRRLSQYSDEEASVPLGLGKWSRKETLGHLIDSAANNHQRFVRLQLEPSLNLPGYEQEGWVGVQRYNDRPWSEIVLLWRAYNRHLAHGIAHMREECLKHTWWFEGEHHTLRYLVEDYAAHMEHHLRQIFSGD